MSKVQINPLKMALTQCKQVFVMVFIFAFAVNFLNVITPLYSLQVLDRVLGTGSIDTLINLTIIMLAIYIALNLLQVARSFTLIKMGEWLDQKLAPITFAQTISVAAARSSVGASQSQRDLETVKGFVSSMGINTLFDAPWSIVYITVMFIIHPYLGYLTIAGAVILVIFALLNAYATSELLAKSNEHFVRSMNQAEIATRNAAVIEAMGMLESVIKNWQNLSKGKIDHQSAASYRNGIISNISKFVRMILQMFVTAVGGYLVIENQMTTGGMIIGSIIMGRALQPFDAAIETWKQITNAKKSYERLNNSFEQGQIREEAMSLPAPEGYLSVEKLYYAPPSINPKVASRYTLREVSFDLQPADILAVIGPSAAGKSSLANLMVGVWRAASGIVRLDGADVYTWNRKDFGKYVGYLPQGIELFNGTIKDNIARMNMDSDPQEIVDAAKLAGAHEMILRLPSGYETDIGIGGSALSAGQRQRIGLARAFFGKPKLVILDEPNANLDELGEQALAQSLINAKANNITTIIISHRPSILSCVDKILILQDGMVAAFGGRDEILAKFAQQRQST